MFRDNVATKDREIVENSSMIKFQVPYIRPETLQLFLRPVLDRSCRMEKDTSDGVICLLVNQGGCNARICCIHQG